MTYRIEVLKPTQEDWHGSYVVDGWYAGTQRQMFVGVIFNGNITAYDKSLPPVWRTCVWGNDDCGMDYDCDNEAECLNVFMQVIGMKYVNRAELVKLGFIPA